MINMLKKMVARRNFSSVDFATLETAMMLAALDGEVSAERQHAFDVLAEMAAADGDFSEIERRAIDALKTAVAKSREELMTMLYPRAVG